MTDLHVQRTGAGSPVVLLHGFTGAIEAMAGLRERLETDHEVISVDLVGHGSSPAPPHLDAYSVDAMADDVGAVIGAGSAHLVGYSMGGRVALTLACRSPERVRTLSLIGASAGIADPDDREARRADDEELARCILTDGLESFVDRWMANPLFAGQQRLGDDHLTRSRRQRLGNDPVGLANSLRGGGTGSMTPLHDRLAGCSVPTCLIVGELDAKFRAVAAGLHESLPVSSVVVIGDAGHAAHLEQPRRVTEAIRDQLA